ncbi:FliI/YscN family ATPase [Dyella terrae]|uniref:FliI/YscN family ATPase n=1 Tax=Dyella terrae TaxID=522259 RepID=UPI001EFE6D6E|nr:FliI/YscN family ATPase [Dyella terrae]ULU23713.1 FliI/YscN family ATPase [Dyella terrae]
MGAAVAKLERILASATWVRRVGRLVAFNGLVIEAEGPDAVIGELCHVFGDANEAPVLAEVVGFREGRVLLMPFGHLRGKPVGAVVEALGRRLRVPVGRDMIGRVSDAFGNPLDDKPPFRAETDRDLYGSAINPLARAPLSEGLETGVRAIDTLVPLAKGQRVGIFAGSGVGKSTLLGMLAGHVRADVIVVGLIGERGREVADFLHDALSKEGRARSVLIVATADQPALQRTHAVHAAHAVAEYFRDLGKDVLLVIDSITRFAMAQREVGLATGEPPTSRGYPPSVFNLLPQILERGGSLKGSGTITAIYSVLVEGDDMNEPVADHMRAILDGHIALSRDLASRGQLPAIDLLSSISRLQSKVCQADELELMQRVRSMIAVHEASRDLVDMGAYQAGANPSLDEALRRHPDMVEFIRQMPGERTTKERSMHMLRELMTKGAE